MSTQPGECLGHGGVNVPVFVWLLPRLPDYSPPLPDLRTRRAPPRGECVKDMPAFFKRYRGQSWALPSQSPRHRPQASLVLFWGESLLIDADHKQGSKLPECSPPQTQHSIIIILFFVWEEALPKSQISIRNTVLKSHNDRVWSDN